MYIFPKEYWRFDMMGFQRFAGLRAGPAQAGPGQTEPGPGQTQHDPKGVPRRPGQARPEVFVPPLFGLVWLWFW